MKWQPIETAPLDNAKPLLLAKFRDGELIQLDFDGTWTSECESWELPQVYYYWATAHGYVEEPTHWMYQPEPPEYDGEEDFSDEIGIASYDAGEFYK